MTGTPPARENHAAAGRRGEELALRFLENKNYKLVQRNYRHGRGEIDLILDDAGTLVFVEVKASRSRNNGHPLEKIDGRKILQLQRMAQRYCWQYRQEHRAMRFDVVGVDLSGENPDAAILHLENAFLPDGQGYFR